MTSTDFPDFSAAEPATAVPLANITITPNLETDVMGKDVSLWGAIYILARSNAAIGSSEWALLRVKWETDITLPNSVIHEYQVILKGASVYREVLPVIGRRAAITIEAMGPTHVESYDFIITPMLNYAPSRPNKLLITEVLTTVAAGATDSKETTVVAPGPASLIYASNATTWVAQLQRFDLAGTWTTFVRMQSATGNPAADNMIVSLPPGPVRSQFINLDGASKQYHLALLAHHGA